MAEPVLMPQVGQDIKTARIVDWLKKVNDPVKKGEVIAVVESDKAAFDVEAYSAGVLLKILYPQGEEVEVLTPIAYIGSPGEKIEDGGQRAADRERKGGSVKAEGLGDGARAPTQDHRQAAHGAPQRATSRWGPLDDATLPTRGWRLEGRMAISPSARRLAREQGVRLDAVTGTGPGGRITKQDVLAAISQDAAGREVTQPGDTVIPFSPMRARIADRLTRSKQTIPHFYISMDVDMSEAMRWRRQLDETSGTKVTVTDMIVKAVALALTQYPKMNSHVEPDRIILKAAVNVGVAVAVEGGLIVPVIADADKKGVVEIGSAARENAEAARAGRLKPQAIGGFTVTNLGMHGVDVFVPVINPPEAAILAVGTVARKPAVIDDKIVARDMMTMTLACDHRAVDGTYAAQFLGKIKEHLEHPASVARASCP
jgi:pyruvate dehydrogenase E2 component (dihydrolipoamide acetyltransferase)